jgi:hypothetical protein
MGWSTEFRAMLQKTELKPSWHVRVVDTLSAWGGTWSAATEARRLSAVAEIVPGSVRVNGQRLNIQTCSVSGGGFSFVVRDIAEVLPYVTRGEILALSLGEAGWDKSAYNDVALGEVVQVSCNGSRAARIDCMDATGLLRNRPGETATTCRLFYDVDGLTDVGVTYSGSSSILRVTSGSITGFSQETGGTGAVKVLASTPYYVTYTAKGTDRFTGCTGGTFGSTGVSAGIGTDVQEVALLRGIPHDIFARILTSTGNGTNGSFDDYPKSWGLALREGIVNTGDLALWRLWYVAQTSGTVEWDLIAEGPVDDGYQWLMSTLRLGGLFPCVVEGGLSLRQLTAHTADPFSAITITDADIAAGASAINYQAWSSSQPYEYGAVRASQPAYAGVTFAPFAPFQPYSSGGSKAIFGDPTITRVTATETIATHPAAEEYVTTLGMPTTGTRILNTNVGNQLEAIRDRLEPAAMRVGERLTLRCSGLRLSQLALGDRPLLYTSRWAGRDSGGSRLQAPLRTLVTGVDVDWGAGEVTVELHIRPDYSEAYP